jgi:hypothetical protein
MPSASPPRHEVTARSPADVDTAPRPAVVVFAARVTRQHEPCRDDVEPLDGAEVWHRFPGIAPAVTAGQDTTTPDHLPLIGPAPVVGGL